jgi:hypothetical protein
MIITTAAVHFTIFNNDSTHSNKHVPCYGMNYQLFEDENKQTGV